MRISQLQERIKIWADGVFPHRTAWNAATKLMMEEIPEWAQAMDDPMEYADLVILILDVASLKGIDVEKAVMEKMDINEGRNWVIDKEKGTMHHE